jgi:hypothetical protein
MPIPKSDRDVLLDVPQWLLKKMAKVEPSPVVGGDGEGVYYVGKFSDTWAPEDLRNREFYYVHAKSIFKPDQVIGMPRLDKTEVAGDPLFPLYATVLCNIFFTNMCAPNDTNITWSNCLDPQFENCAEGINSSTVSSTSYGKCYWIGGGIYAPAMFIFSAAPSSYTDDVNLVAYSKPCPVYSSATSLSGKAETSGKVLIRAVGCDDSSNRVRYVRYTSEDRNSTTYTIAYLGIGGYTAGNAINIWMRYGLTSSVVKNANDYYYYIYTIGFQYQ